MKIALLGYGKMGQLIARLAAERGHTLISIDPQVPQADFREVSAAALQGAAVCIDFSRPDAVPANVRVLAELKVNTVIGTTGWYEHLPEVRAVVEQGGIGCLYATNFSLGVQIFFRAVAAAAQLMERAEEYDVAGIEYHHQRKLDSPSGTALTLGEILTRHITRKQRLVFDRVERRIEPDELHFASVRCGAIPGTHEVVFDSEADSITLKHTARNRNGFALGAVLAAEWLQSRRGFFTIEDFLAERLA